MRIQRRWPVAVLGLGILMGTSADFPLFAAEPKPEQKQPADAPIDWEKARELHQKSERGEKLTADEQAYYEKARAARANRAEAAAPAPAGDIDWNRARALHDRAGRGEKLSADDQAYYDKAKAAVQRGQGPGGNGANNPGRPPAGQGPGPSRESTGMIPLDQLGQEKYKGFEGGLYGGGKNAPTAAHLAAASAAAGRIVPLDADGKPKADGKIVLLSIGMSNTTQEFSRFKQLADDPDSGKATHVVVVDAAQGGRAADDWTDSKQNTWQEADRRLAAQQVAPKQVQAVWIKQARKMPASLGAFPEHARALQDDLEHILRAAKERYPNLRIAYLSSRIYAGYAASALNPEPYAYEGAFSVRWTIEKQAAGDSTLNYDPAKGEVKAPVALWGPYLWSDGTKGRQSDKLIYERKDLGPDGTHPSESGRQKVAELLLEYLKTDATAKAWFAKK